MTFARLRSFLMTLTRRERFEDALDEEVRFHLDAHTDDLVRSGLPRREAARRARVHFGNVERAKDDCRQSRGLRLFDELAQDLRFGVRGLRRNPGFTASGMFIVAFGVASATAIFSVANAAFVQPLPYPEAGRLVAVTRFQPAGAGYGTAHDRDTSAFLADYATSFSRLAATSGSPGLTLASPAGTEHVRNLRVSAEYFRVLGVAPAAGRDLTQRDEQDASTVMLSHGAWLRHFDGSRAAVGRSVRLGGRPYTIIGVMPASFQSFPPVDIWTPFPFRTDPQGIGRNYQLLGRLRADRSAQAAAAELEALAPLLEQQHPGTLREADRLGIRPYQEVLGRNMLPPLVLLSAAVAMFLLIVCLNMAGLLAARAAARHQEFAVRTALGGTAGRLARQLVTESLLLAVAGGAVGLLAAGWSIDGLLGLRPGTAMWDVAMDGSVLVFALAVSVGTGLILGVAPALQARRTDVRSSLHAGDARASAGRHSLRFRRVLVVAQFGLCTVLLVTAGLLIESLANLTRVELGFNPTGVVTARASLQDSSYTDTLAVAGLFRSTLDAIRRIPGVERAAVASNVPVERGLNLPIHTPRPSAETPIFSVDWRYVTEGYFETMEIPLREGRLLDARDTAGSQPVALVNEAFATRLLEVGRAVGSEVRVYEAVPELRDAARTIVGVVGTVKTGGSLSLPPVPTMFVPIEQVPAGLLAAAHSFIQVNWLVRTTGSNPELLATIEDTLGGAAGPIPVSGLRTMDQVIGAVVIEERFRAVLLTIFALAALVLAAAGLYAVMAFVVRQRMREVGIRLALGAAPAQVRRSFLAQGLLLGGSGVIAGLAVTFFVARLLQSFLFGIQPSDAPTVGAAAGVLLAVALIAAYVPTRRATRMDPVAVLRSE